jgi:hypothetical protein
MEHPDIQPALHCLLPPPPDVIVKIVYSTGMTYPMDGGAAHSR